jgi:hypothetical protein
MNGTCLVVSLEQLGTLLEVLGRTSFELLVGDQFNTLSPGGSLSRFGSLGRLRSGIGLGTGGGTSSCGLFALR